MQMPKPNTDGHGDVARTQGWVARACSYSATLPPKEPKQPKASKARPAAADRLPPICAAEPRTPRLPLPAVRCCR